MDQRAMLMKLLNQGVPMATACEAFGVCRATGYKWKARYEREGPAGLEERSRAPHHRPHAMDGRLEKRILEAHTKYGWGAKKLKAVLEARHPKVSWPAASTIGEVLKRHGRVRPRRRERRPQTLTPRPLQEVTAANDTWAVDFKGEFRLGNGRLCYPLTISDQHSRMLLCCHGFTRIGQAETYQRIAQTLEEYGAPKRFRSDNGIPFRLGFSVWLADRGIDHEPTRPGTPSDNGRHERMHRTLKEAVARPPRRTLKAQQKAFDVFQHRYNHERPHEALGLRPPRTHYRRSPAPGQAEEALHLSRAHGTEARPFQRIPSMEPRHRVPQRGSSTPDRRPPGSRRRRLGSPLPPTHPWISHRQTHLEPAPRGVYDVAGLMSAMCSGLPTQALCSGRSIPLRGRSIHPNSSSHGYALRNAHWRAEAEATSASLPATRGGA